jgi:hypothetical protein
MSEVRHQLLITLVHGTWGRGFFPRRRRQVENVHALTARSGTWQETTEMVKKLNRTLRGWANPAASIEKAPMNYFEVGTVKGRRPLWFEERSPFLARLSDELDDIPHKIKPLLWSGKNSIFERDKTARVLADYLSAEHIEHPQATQLIIAHSHGGNIALRALDHLQKRDASQLYGAESANPFVVTLATPFIEIHQANLGERPFYIRSARMVVMLVLSLSPLALLWDLDVLTFKSNAYGATITGIFFYIYLVAIGLMVPWVVFGRATARQNQLDALKEATRLGESPQRLLVIRAIDDEASLALALGAIFNYLTARSIAFLYLFLFSLLSFVVLHPGIISRFLWELWALRALGEGFFALTIMLLGALIVSRSVHGRELAVSPIECQINTQSAPDADDLSKVITLVSHRDVKSLRHGIYEHENCAKAISDWVRSQLGGGKSAQLLAAVDTPYAIPRTKLEAALERLPDMAAELIGRVLSPFNRAPAKVAASEPVKADDALVWKDLGRASLSGDHHAFEAPAATGKYRVSPIDTVSSGEFDFDGWAVEHQPSDNPEDFKRRRRIKSGVQRSEQAKAIAQQDHDRGGDAS